MEIINLDKICGGCAAANLGTKLDTLKKDLADGNTYSGELLSEDEEKALNNICPVLSQLSLGTYINNMLKASQEGAEIENLTEEQVNILNNQTCGGFESVQVGTEIFSFVEEINEGGGSVDYTIKVNKIEYGQPYAKDDDSNPSPSEVATYLIDKWDAGESFTLKIENETHSYVGTATPVDIDGDVHSRGLYLFVSNDKNTGMLIEGIAASGDEKGSFVFEEVYPYFLSYNATYNGKEYIGVIKSDVYTVNVEVDDDVDLANVTIDFIPYPGVTSVKIGNVEQVSGEVVNCVNPNIYTLTTVTGESHDWTVTVKRHEIN